MKTLPRTDEIMAWPVIQGKMGVPDECGFFHKPGQKVLATPLGLVVTEEIHCITCGIRLLEKDVR